MRLFARLCPVVCAALFCGAAFAPLTTRAQTQIQAGQVVISELRLRGPGGSADEFVELYNNTDQAVTVQALDGSAGWSVVVSNGQITGPLFTVANGTVIPARGHLLGANANGYSLSAYPSGNPNQSTVGDAVVGPFATAAPDHTWNIDAPDGSGVALFATTNGTNFTAATRLDAFGYTNSPALYKEGAGFQRVVTAASEHTYYRNLRGGFPQDTNDNGADFLLVGTIVNIQIPRIGAPGPENLASPVVNNETMATALLDPTVSASSLPNRERRTTPELNANFGTMFIRRTVTNNTGQPVTRLRFRVINTTTTGTPSSECDGVNCADVRALDSGDGTAVVSGGQTVVVRGVRLEQPPAQPAGGGYNASLSADFITLATPLPAGQSVNVEFKLGVMRTGPFRFILNIEAQNAPVIISPASRALRVSGVRR